MKKAMVIAAMAVGMMASNALAGVETSSGVGTTKAEACESAKSLAINAATHKWDAGINPQEVTNISCDCSKDNDNNRYTCTATATYQKQK